MSNPELVSRFERRSAARRAPEVTQGPLTQPWSNRLPDEEWRVYERVVHEARRSGVQFAFGGAFATAVYTGELRNTKDFDFYIQPRDLDAMKAGISRAGLTDHFERLAYDRTWIYRASHGDVLVDVIWAMANQRAVVDSLWLSRGPLVEIRGEQMRAIPLEELIWAKLYVLQRDRTDWGDVLNLLSAQTASIDWDHLMNRLGDDTPLLGAALLVFAWLDPDRARSIPDQVWNQLRIAPASGEGQNMVDSRARAALLDSRPWFREPTR
jgi:hypothetical protein